MFGHSVCEERTEGGMMVLRTCQATIFTVLFSLLPALCFAGAIVYVYDPPHDERYPTARVDIVLETAEYLDHVHNKMEEQANRPGQGWLVCESSGWFATAMGIEGGFPKWSELLRTSPDELPVVDWPATAVAGVCGLDSREDAERRAVSLCSEHRANVTCEVGFSGFDDGTVSFYSEYFPSEEDPVWVMRNPDAGTYSEYWLGHVGHARYTGHQISVKQHDQAMEIWANLGNIVWIPSE